jgi:adenylate cyclase
MEVTSGDEPASAPRHDGQTPQPCRSHSSAAANARAALERPEPGGPVNSQAEVMPAA